MLKLISWNVNGLRACYDKGFADAFRRLDADFFCLQDTVFIFMAGGYHKLNPGMKVKVSDAAEDKKPEETL